MVRKNRQIKKTNLYNIFTLIPKQYSYLKALYSEKQLIDLYEKYKTHINSMGCSVYSDVFTLFDTMEEQTNSESQELIINPESIYIKIMYFLDYGFYCFDLLPLLKKSRGKKRDFILGFHQHVFSNETDNWNISLNLEYLRNEKEEYNNIMKELKKYSKKISKCYFGELCNYDFKDDTIFLMKELINDYSILINNQEENDSDMDIIPFHSRFINVLGNDLYDFVSNVIDGICDGILEEIEEMVELGTDIKENKVIKRFNTNLGLLWQKTMI